MSQLTADCLIEIFEYLSKNSLYSCLLVNKLWCNISVRILWRDSSTYNLRTFRTLISCLPDESKEILSKNKIIYSFPKPPTFNYASFCRVLSIYELQNKFRNYIILIEIFKLFMRQIPSLKQLDASSFKDLPIINFTSFPGAKNCLTNITELQMFPNIDTEILYHLTQYCHNIQSLSIEFCIHIISDGLKEFLFSIQKNLKCFCIIQSGNCPGLIDLISSFTTKLYNTVTKFHISVENENISFSFINKFTNLQVLEIENYESLDVFGTLVSYNFPYLKSLKIDVFSLNTNSAIKFLENHGKNLEEIAFCEMSGENDNSLNLAIAKYCINLKELSTGFKKNELETLKIVLTSCKHLEAIKIWLGEVNLLYEKVALEAILNYSPKNLNRIELLYHHESYTEKLLPEDLNSFFIKWTKRVPFIPITIFIKRLNITESLDTDKENLDIIDKYIRLDVIKKFVISVDQDEICVERTYH
jgi:hypothetical protein